MGNDYTDKVDTIARMLLELRGRTPEPGETGVQRISWAFGQVALSKESVTPEDERRLREYAEQAVCASYEEQIAETRAELTRLRAVAEAARALVPYLDCYRHCAMSGHDRETTCNVERLRAALAALEGT